MSQRIKGILFDLGGTLLHFGEPDIPRVFRAGAELAYEYLRSLDQPLPAFATFHRRQWWAIRWRYLLSHLTGREFNSLDLTIRLGKRMGHNLTRRQSLELSWRWYQPLGQHAWLEPGARQTLQSFHQEGLTLGLVSNTFIAGEVLDRHLRQEGLLDLLPIRVYSSQVVHRKPDRRIFERALRQGGLRAERTLFVGDLLDVDIKGANRAGLISVLKDPADRHAKARIKPRHRIRKLSDLSEILSQYNGGE